jgi:hypothetical protein
MVLMTHHLLTMEVRDNRHRYNPLRPSLYIVADDGQYYALSDLDKVELVANVLQFLLR